MKSEKLMDYIGQIDDSIIEEADGSIAKVKPVKRSWIKWASVGVAAVACLIIAVSFMFNQKQPTDPVDYTNLPKLTVNTEFGAFGFEGHMAFHIDELRDNNPWTEKNNLTTLPVFNNPMDYDRAGAPINGLSPEEMLAKAEEIANILGLEITSLYTTPTQEQIKQIMQKLEGVNASDEEIRMNTTAYNATAKCNGASIEVQNSGHIVLSLTPETAYLAKEIEKLSVYDSFTISFEYGYETIDDTQYSVGFPLPNGYSFTFDNTSYEQAMEITKYLFSEYGSFTGITEPGYNLFADYTYSGVLTRLYTTVFENAGNLTDRILNFNFSNIRFHASDMGGISGISYTKTDLSQKIGDYPIITADEARQLLLDRHYITTVPEEMPGEKYIANVELIYRTSRRDTIFMPYYKFFIEMPSMQRENGLKTYGVFYVPAVKGEYLENMPLWDGSFN